MNGLREIEIVCYIGDRDAWKAQGVEFRERFKKFAKENGFDGNVFEVHSPKRSTSTYTANRIKKGAKT